MMTIPIMMTLPGEHPGAQGDTWGTPGPFGRNRASHTRAELVAGQHGGHRTRTCTGLRPAVFKTAALPVRSSPPDYYY